MERVSREFVFDQLLLHDVLPWNEKETNAILFVIEYRPSGVHIIHLNRCLTFYSSIYLKYNILSGTCDYLQCNYYIT